MDDSSTVVPIINRLRQALTHWCCARRIGWTRALAPACRIRRIDCAQAAFPLIDSIPESYPIAACTLLRWTISRDSQAIYARTEQQLMNTSPIDTRETSLIHAIPLTHESTDYAMLAFYPKAAAITFEPRIKLILIENQLKRKNKKSYVIDVCLFKGSLLRELRFLKRNLLMVTQR